MIDIDELLPETLTYAPHAPEPTALRFIRDAAKIFCEKTRIWREWDEISVTGDDEGEGVTTFSDAQIYRIEQAILKDTDGGEYILEPKPPEWLDANVPKWKFSFAETEGTPQYCTQTRPDTVMVIPKATGTLTVRLVLLPSRNAITVPDFLVEKYAETIGKGAAARLLTLPQVEYANPQLGAALNQGFMKDIDDIRSDVQKTQLRARNHTVASFF